MDGLKDTSVFATAAAQQSVISPTQYRKLSLQVYGEAFSDLNLMNTSATTATGVAMQEQGLPDEDPLAFADGVSEQEESEEGEDEGDEDNIDQ